MRTLVEATHHYHIVGRNGTADLCGDLQLGKVAMPRGPRSEKRPADVIGAGRSAGVVGTARRKGGSG
jgi:hypothetical protein